MASLRSPVFSPNQRSSTRSSLLRTPPTSAVDRAASSFEGVASPVEDWDFAMTDLPAYPHITARHVAHRGGGRGQGRLRGGRAAAPAGLLSEPATVGLGSNSAGLRQKLRSSAAGSLLSRLIYGSPRSRRPPLVPSATASVGHMFIATCRFDSMPALRRAQGLEPVETALHPPRGDAVGTVFGAEPSKCTGGTCTRVDVRFAGARVSEHFARF